MGGKMGRGAAWVACVALLCLAGAKQDADSTAMFREKARNYLRKSGRPIPETLKKGGMAMALDASSLPRLEKALSEDTQNLAKQERIQKVQTKQKRHAATKLRKARETLQKARRLSQARVMKRPIQTTTAPAGSLTKRHQEPQGSRQHGKGQKSSVVAQAKELRQKGQAVLLKAHEDKNGL